MTTWKWLEDGKSVELMTDAREIALFVTSNIKEHEWNEYYAKMAEDGEIYTLLKRARLAFDQGLAEYRSAYANLKELLRELAKARNAVDSLAADVGCFFTPINLTEKFGRDKEGLRDFALQFVARAYVGSLKVT